VLHAGYNAFVSMRREGEGFETVPVNRGTCSTAEYNRYTTICLADMKGSAATKPVTPQMNKMNRFLAQLPFRMPQLAPRPPKITPTDANNALLRLITYINANRTSRKLIRVRNMWKCLFFTCSSKIREIADLAPVLASIPVVFVGAKKGNIGVGSPAKDLGIVLSYLDTRSGTHDEPQFFKFIRETFMDPATASLRTDIEFGKLSQKVDPTHIFA
jgi:hypothetical protein